MIFLGLKTGMADVKYGLLQLPVYRIDTIRGVIVCNISKMGLRCLPSHAPKINGKIIVEMSVWCQVDIPKLVYIE